MTNEQRSMTEKEAILRIGTYESYHLGLSSFGKTGPGFKSDKMKNLIKILAVLLLTATLIDSAQAQDKYIDISNDNGILFHDAGEAGVIDFHAHTGGMSEYSYLKLRASETDTLENNIIITRGGVLSIGTVDPEDEYGIYTPTDAPETMKLIVHNGSAVYKSPDWETFSDQRLKKNIAPYHKGLNTLHQLNFYEYEYNGLAQTSNDGSRYVGVMAQEIKDILPNTVGSFHSRLRPGKGEVQELYTFNPNELLYIALNSIKQVDEKTEALKQKSEALEEANQQLTTLQKQCDDLQEQLTKIEAYLGLDQAKHKQIDQGHSPTSYRIDNCIPNPSSGLTKIPYQLNASFQSASIMIYDYNGRLVESFKIEAQGQGSIDWNSSRLAKGLYTYSLIVDDRLIETRRVIVS